MVKSMGVCSTTKTSILHVTLSGMSQESLGRRAWYVLGEVSIACVRELG